MTTSNTIKIITYTIATVLTYAAMSYASIWLEQLGMQNNTFGKFSCRYIIWSIPAIVATFVIIHPQKNILKALGLDANLPKGFLVALISTIPLFVGFRIMGTLRDGWDIEFLCRKALFPGFFEEFIFRGFLFGMLFRYCKLGFIWSALIPSVFFGICHIYQGSDFITCLPVFAVTFIGAIYFSWMYVGWKFNLWVPVFLHILMNAAWVTFSMEGTDNAAGSLISNVLRALSIVIAIGITVWYRKHKC